MSITTPLTQAKMTAAHREVRKVPLPVNHQGGPLRVSEYYGENVFDITKAEGIPETLRRELVEVMQSKQALKKENAEMIATAVTEWACQKGATHFCHWFQPLTGGTAEKHDAFLDITSTGPIEKLSASALMQGEPDASSFPNGGSRSTFEARGYTSWDMSSPIFISEGPNGKTVCIPTAFVSYFGEALDVKTPLLRAMSRMDEVGTKFMNLCGSKETKHVTITAGCEQEYFLIDRAFYYQRPDLVMTGRTMFGRMSNKNQQLDDHYFGSIDRRVMGFMQELDLELHRLGVAAKTRHNEVAPGQFEIAAIFRDANVAADQNQMVMEQIRKISRKHQFEAILHEKPFAGINGSGKHVNWSLADDTGVNMLEPGNRPENNNRFLALVAMISESVWRHGDAIRMAIASASNDHRLGANEAPPSIISLYLGDALEKIFAAIKSGKQLNFNEPGAIDLGAQQLSSLQRDNTDRNRTSPFAFTGNKFEFRAVGSTAAVGFPISIFAGALVEVMDESNQLLEKLIAEGKTIDQALSEVTKKWVDSSYNVIFNGDGYSDEWVVEAKKRGLPNLKTTADALPVLKDEKASDFLVKQGVFTRDELTTRYNVLVERYITLREIEFNTLISMVHQSVLPALIEYKKELSAVIDQQEEIKLECKVEKEMYKRLNFAAEGVYDTLIQLENMIKALPEDEEKRSLAIANEALPLSETLAEKIGELEQLIPEDCWGIPKYFDMLFVR